MSVITTNIDNSKIFLGNCYYEQREYTNGTGSEITLAAGQSMGLIFATNKVDKCLSTNTNGSQVPHSVLKRAVTVANGATVTVTVGVWGSVAKEMVILSGADTWATPISLTDSATNTVVIGTIEALFRKAGILPLEGDELSAYNNF